MEEFVQTHVHEHVSVVTIRTVTKMFKQGLTIPYIARYQKDRIDGADAKTLRQVEEAMHAYDNLQGRISKVLKSIENLEVSQGYINQIKAATTLDDVEALYQPYKKGGKGTYAERAKKLGLNDAAQHLLKGQQVNIEQLVNQKAKGLQSLAEVKKGISHIVAGEIANKNEIFQKLFQEAYTYVFVLTKRTKDGVDKNEKFKDYYDIKRNITNLKEHQILAINRAEKQSIITVKLQIHEAQRNRFIYWIKQTYNCNKNNLVNEAIEDGFKRLLEPRFFRKIRSKLKKEAEVKSMNIFSENIRKLLLIAPIREKVLSIDPGFKNGCKIAVLDKNAKMLTTAVIHPFTQSNKNNQAETVLIELIQKHRIKHIAIGNGTACRETERLVAKLIESNKIAAKYSIVDESGASIYSITEDASKEFGHLDPNLISAVSIGRRLQDPLLEICKLDPKTIGVGMYQHDVDQKTLSGVLEHSLSDVVNMVGVDVNSCSIHMLKRISGLSTKQAQAIIEYRTKKNGIHNRQELLQIKGIGQISYKNACGFLRILPDTLQEVIEIDDSESEPNEDVSIGTKRKIKTETKSRKKTKTGSACQLEPLDRTIIHPESYDIANKLLKHLKTSADVIGTRKMVELTQNLDPKRLAKEIGTSHHTMELILTAYKQTEESFRKDFSKPVFKSSIININDLKIGTLCDGVVRNVTSFGAFIDIGVNKNALLHVSKFCGRSFGPGDRVRCKVDSLDIEKGRISLLLA
ncbi:S1 RNA-binding domain-containing protein 1-like [Clytia hemisphaerica]|uniref:S1 motif domain-containing protein n=1 Tax=Clytia hemisphaerica TaxID=252671 RepID=A0A7M5WI23_9CNID